MPAARAGFSRHWIFTGLFALALLGSGLAYLAGAPFIREALEHLGYPPYLRFILGTAKVLGVAALLQPRWPVLREWAYAGFTINMIGAAASHAFSGDPLLRIALPLGLLGVLSISYLLRRSGARRSKERIWTGAIPAKPPITASVA